MDRGTGLPGRGNNMSKGWVHWGKLEQCNPAGVGGENTGQVCKQGLGMPAEDRTGGMGQAFRQQFFFILCCCQTRVSNSYFLKTR